MFRHDIQWGFFPEHSPKPSECSEVAEYLSLDTGSKAFYTAKHTIWNPSSLAISKFEISMALCMRQISNANAI